MTHIASRLEFVTLDELEVGFADRLGTEAVFLPRSILGTAQDVLYVGAAVLVDIQTALGEKALSFEGYVAWAYPGAPRTPPGREAGTGIWIERIVDEDSVARAARMRRRPGAGGRVRIPGTRLPALRLPVSPPSAPKKTASTPPMPATLFTPPKTPPPVVMTSSDTGLPVEAEPGPALPLSDVEVDASGEIVVSHPPAPQPRLMAMGLLVDQSFDPTPSPGPPPLELEDRPTDERLDIHMAGILAPPVGTLEGLPIHDAPRAISLEGLPDAPVVVPAAFFEQRQTDVDLLVSLDDADFFPAELEEQRARARRSVRSQEPPALDPAQHTSVAPLQPAPGVGSEHSAVAAAQAVGAERSAAVGAERSAAVGAVAAAQAVGAERSEGAERSAAVGAVNPALAEPTVMSWDQLDDLPPDLPPDLPGDVADERSTDFADAARVAAARALTEAREEADAAARARALAEARAEADAIAHAALEADELRAQAQRAERASLEASARAADAVPLPAAMMAEPFAPRTADVDELAKSAARDVTPELARDLAQNLTSDLARELAEDDLAADDDDLAPEDLSDSDVELLPDVASDEFAILPALRLEGATADTADTTQPRPPSEEPSDLDVVGGVIDPLLDPPEFSVAEQTAIINARPASKRSGEWDGRTEHSNPETAEGASTRTAEATSSDADQSPAEASAVPVPPPRALPAPEGFPPTPEIAPGIMGCAFLVSVKRGGDGVHAIEPFTWPRNGTKRWNALDVAREDGEDLDIAIAQSPWLARDPSAGPPSTFPELGIEPSAFEVGMTDPGVSVADVVGKAVQLAAEDGDDNVFSDMPASVRPAMKRPDDEGDPTMDSTVDEGNAPLASPDDEEIETDRDLKRPPSQASPETRARLGVLQKILGRR